MNRSRICTNPPPAFGGKPCPWVSNEMRACNKAPCPSNVFFLIFCQFRNGLCQILTGYNSYNVNATDAKSLLYLFSLVAPVFFCVLFFILIPFVYFCYL